MSDVNIDAEEFFWRLCAETDELSSNIGKALDLSQSSHMLATKSNEIATDGVEKIEKVGDMVTNVAEDARKITSFITTISQIARHAHILSLNAAVESAHAGEKGRGFSVIASEMRKLSEAIKGSTSEANKLLKNSITMVNDANDVAEETTETVELLQMSAELVTEFTEQVNTSVVEKNRNIMSMQRTLMRVIANVRTEKELLLTKKVA
jgi:methyl-accepting chemotaxis protein